MKRILLFITLFTYTTLFAQTKFEKDFFNLTNLVRTNPKYIASLIQKESGKSLSKFNKDSLNKVVDILNTLPTTDPLVFDTTMYNNMEGNVGYLGISYITIDKSGVKDTVMGSTHDKRFLQKYNYGENIGPYIDDPLISLINLLEDKYNWIDKYATITTTYLNGKKSVKTKFTPSVTHKPHFDNLISKDYTKTAVRVNLGVDGKLHLFQDFSNQ